MFENGVVVFFICGGLVVVSLIIFWVIYDPEGSESDTDQPWW